MLTSFLTNCSNDTEVPEGGICPSLLDIFSSDTVM